MHAQHYQHCTSSVVMLNINVRRSDKCQEWERMPTCILMIQLTLFVADQAIATDLDNFAKELKKTTIVQYSFVMFSDFFQYTNINIH